MKREIVLKGNRDLLDLWGMVDPGTSPYWWTNTPSKKLYQVWNEGAASGPIANQYAYVWPTDGVSGSHAIGFELGPTLTRFTSMTITTAWDLSAGGGSNPYFFPPDNASGPSCAIILRNRTQDGWISGTGSAAHTMLSTDTYYTNIYTEGPYVSLKDMSWTMTAHPQGGPWVLEDINNLGVGVQFGWTNATAGDDAGYAYARFHRAFHKMRVPFLKVVLEVEDLGGYVENVRAASSYELRLMRRARNVLSPKTFIDEAPVGIGNQVNLSHPKGPSVGGEGWGQRVLERRAGLVLARTYEPETFKCQDEVFDMRPYACLGWAAYRIDAPWNPELQGLSLIEKGRSFVHTRAQDAWSPRPGDNVLYRVLEAYPNLSYHGLAVQGGGDVTKCNRNYDCQQTGWSTVSSAGDFSAAASTTVSMVEEQGYLSSSMLTYGAGGGKGGRERSLGAIGAGRLHLRLVIKNTSISSPLTQNGEWYLRDAANNYWDNTNRTWEAAPVYNAFPSDKPFGEVIVDSIPCDAATYYIGIGRFSTNMGPVTLHAGLVDVQFSDTTVAGARTPLVVLDTPLTRVAETHKMSHVYGRDLWVPERGSAVIEVQPFWRAEDLPSVIKPLLHAQHHATQNTWEAIQYVAGDNAIRFERAIDGLSTFQLDCYLTVLMTRAHVLRAWARWLGADGWNEFGPNSVQVGYAVFLESDGSLVETNSSLGTFSSPIAGLSPLNRWRMAYQRNYLGIGCDATRYLDGYVRMWETRRNPLHELEAIWRI